MRYLIVDTSSRVLLLLANNGKGEIALWASNLDRYGSTLATIIEQTMNQLHLSCRELDFVGAGIGPGSLTGLRVGLSILKGLTFPFDTPIVPFNSLDVLARGLDFDDYLIMRKAREGHYYWREYSRGVARGLTQLSSTQEIVNTTDPSRTILCLEKKENALKFLNYEIEIIQSPSPLSMKTIVLETFERKETVSGQDLSPIYLQRSVAEINWDDRNCENR